MKSILLLVCGVFVLNFVPMSRLMAIQPEVMADSVKTVKLTGKVVDVETGEAIPLSTIWVKELGWGSVCDTEGKFKIDVPVNRKATLTVRSVGYETREVDVAPGTISGLVVKLKKSLLNLDEVVITGTRTEKVISEAPVMTRVVSAEELQRNDYESMMDVLEYNIPGLRFNVDPRGNNIQIQGLENSYILILVDGERLSQTPGGPIDFERLSTSNIKRIEILKGAASALYGSSAMGMVVNIITDSPKRSLEGWAKVRYSKFNDLQLDAGIGLAHKGFFSQTLFRRNSTDGYDLTPETPQSYTMNPSHDMNIEEKVGWNNERTKVMASASFYWNEIKNPPKGESPTHYRSLNKTFRASLEHAFGEENKLYAVYYGDFYTRKTVYDLIDLADSTNATSHEQTVRLTDIYSPLKNVEIVGGVEWNWTRNYNKMQYGKEQTVRKVNDANVFVQVDWQILPELDLVGGFRYTHHSVFGDAYTPKVNLMYAPGSFKFRAGYSRGFKAPGLTELYSDFNMGSVSHNIGNPDLKPEYSNYVSVSAEYTYNGRLSASVEGYQNTIKDKINSFIIDVEDPAPGQLGAEMHYANVEAVRIRGVEGTLTYYPMKQLLLRGTYAYTDARDRETDLQLSGNAKHALNFTTTLRGKLLKRDGSVSLSGRWTSKKLSQSKSTETDDSGQEIEVIRERTKPAYSLWKLVAQYTPWQKKFMRLTLTGGIQNLFDYTDTKHYTTYDAGRRFFGSVIFRF